MPGREAVALLDSIAGVGADGSCGATEDFLVRDRARAELI